MQTPDPVAGQRGRGDLRDRVPGRTDSIEEEEPESGGEQHQQENRRDRAALVQGIEARPVDPVGQRIGGGQHPGCPAGSGRHRVRIISPPR